MTSTTLVHGRVTLALHQLSDGEGRPLLLLHGLGERTPDALAPHFSSWAGPVFGLDFTGHGQSTVPSGGGYSCELLMADADAALAYLGEVTVVGRGLGAYVALLLAGARPDLVRGAILLDGPGMAGGGERPGSPRVSFVDPDAVAPPDPFALADLTADVRPPDYSGTFARQAVQLSGLAEPITVCGIGRQPWVDGIIGEPGVAIADLADALAAYAAV
ncbi:MAG: alpha/beta fold hydrolase [Acidimicrobiales bacterium]